MKKIILSLAGLFVFAIAVNAAEPLTNKNGQKILPEAGDIALGVDATPFLSYFGNFFGKNSDNDYANSAFTGKDYSIYMKYFLTDQSAVRLNVDFGFNKDITKGLVPNDGAVALNNNPDATSIDRAIENSNELMLSLGYEMRRGHGRLQGYWGPMGGFIFGTGVTKYEYANEMNATNSSPNTSNFSGGYARTPLRNLEKKAPSYLSAHLGGFIGVEYFFAPKMSIAGELSLAWNYIWHNQGSQYEVTYQTYDAALGVIEKSKRESATVFNNYGGLNTYTTANLALLFHF